MYRYPTQTVFEFLFKSKSAVNDPNVISFVHTQGCKASRYPELLAGDGRKQKDRSVVARSLHGKYYARPSGVRGKGLPRARYHSPCIFRGWRGAEMFDIYRRFLRRRLALEAGGVRTCSEQYLPRVYLKFSAQSDCRHEIIGPGPKVEGYFQLRPSLDNR